MKELSVSAEREKIALQQRTDNNGKYCTSIAVVIATNARLPLIMQHIMSKTDEWTFLFFCSFNIHEKNACDINRQKQKEKKKHHR